MLHPGYLLLVSVSYRLLQHRCIRAPSRSVLCPGNLAFIMRVWRLLPAFLRCMYFGLGSSCLFSLAADP